MKPFFTSRYRHIGRYREIVNIISKHGLKSLLDAFGLNSGIGVLWRRRDEEQQPANTAERLRVVLQELGPTFIKLGQILSTRPDLLPPVFITELEKLQDKVPSVEFPQIKAILEQETGRNIDQIFSRLDTVPMASASIGQVHEAFMLSGEHVVVKVQRAGVERVIDTDLEILYDVANVLEARTIWGKHYNVVQMVEEFSRSIREELDYSIEGRNAEKMRNNLTDDGTVCIPKVYWAFSTTRILILEYMEGIKITSVEEIEKAGLDRSKLARRIASAIFKQLLIDGFFHADPHPGNVAAGKDNAILFMDFGMVGRIDDSMKEKLGLMLLNIVRRDSEGIVRVLIDIGDAHKKLDKVKLKRDIDHLFDKYYNRPLSEIRIGDALRELLQLSFVYHIRVPVELVLMIRCLVLLESVVEQLDRTVSVVDLAEPFGKRLLQDKMMPGQLGKTASNYLFQMSALTAGLPQRIDNLFDIIEEGELNVKLEHKNFSKFMKDFTLVGNRISFSLVVASIIIGSSIIAQKGMKIVLWRFPVAEAGFLIAMPLGIWLLISIIKSGRI
ncbi:MAG TPA: AarF/ABC1/UbiB kinase family protein [Desulfobacteria bacterium]|nr:AarF/ABC1/UbiB kinase family protein [Desulfobacteria bacterium]